MELEREAFFTGKVQINKNTKPTVRDKQPLGQEAGISCFVGKALKLPWDSL